MGINTPPSCDSSSVKENKRRNKNKAKRGQLKDVRSTLLQIGVWSAPSDCRLHHRLVELIITVIVTIANVVKYSKLVNEEECEGKDVCIGPIIKYCVFDAFFGILCSILLFIGARMRHRCLLIFWIIITLGCSIKYLYVFIVCDWTSLEDWVSISYLAFYTVVTLVVVSFTKECGTSDGGVIHDYGAPPAYKA